MDHLFVWKPFLEFFVVGFSIYRALLFSLTHRNFLTLSMLLAISFLFLSEAPSSLMGHPGYETFYRYLTGGILVLFIFEPEMNWFVERYTKGHPTKKFLEANGPLDEIVKACATLASSKTGALLAIKRNEDLNPFIEKSVVIDALIRHELLLTIFTPPTYLHDGGVILSYDRIVSCAVIFPLTQSSLVRKNLGTRHRAALGLSEETDALCIVVSEETGKISIADRGELLYDVPPEELRALIEQSIRFKKLTKNQRD